MAKIPDVLLDPDKLAKDIYEYWVHTICTDLPTDSDEVVKWEDLDEVYQRNFIEAVNVNVVNTLQSYKEECELDQAFKQIAVSKEEAPAEPEMQYKEARCYTCDRVPVSRFGAVCYTCMRNIRNNSGDTGDGRRK